MTNSELPDMEVEVDERDMVDILLAQAVEQPGRYPRCESTEIQNLQTGIASSTPAS